jgi:hypothetical protein
MPQLSEPDLQENLIIEIIEEEERVVFTQEIAAWNEVHL